MTSSQPNHEEPPFIVRWRRGALSDLKWEERSEQLEFEALTRVRAAAEKWAASLTAILGLFGTVLLVKGRDDISKLTVTFQVLVGLVLLAALVTAAVAAYLAALAAQGTPEEVRWPSGPALRQWEREQALLAKGRMKTSRRVTGITLALLVAAVALTWYGPPDDEESGQNVLVVPAAGAPVCGKLRLGPARMLEVQPAGGASALVLTGSQVATVTALEECP
jgi:hypothetical protein